MGSTRMRRKGEESEVMVGVGGVVVEREVVGGTV